MSKTTTNRQKISIFGVDEVGRGALAGPVYLGGVGLSKDFPIFINHQQKDLWYEENEEFKIIRDSKKVTALNRRKILDLILKKQITYFLFSASNRLIDNYGIGSCLSHLLVILIFRIRQISAEMEIIVDGKIKLLENLNLNLLRLILEENNLLKNNPKLVDFLAELVIQKATLNKDFYQKVARENKADDRYLSVALASNLAKVKRDELMSKLGLLYPEFDWQKNKGYGTFDHRVAISKNSLNPYLRESFLGKIIPNLEFRLRKNTTIKKL